MIQKFVRDIELHGHHSECLARFNDKDPDAPVACVCRELDYDDWYAAGEAEYDRRRECDPPLRDMHGSGFVDGWLKDKKGGGG